MRTLTVMEVIPDAFERVTRPPTRLPLVYSGTWSPPLWLARMSVMKPSCLTKCRAYASARRGCWLAELSSDSGPGGSLVGWRGVRR